MKPRTIIISYILMLSFMNCKTFFDDKTLNKPDPIPVFLSNKKELHIFIEDHKIDGNQIIIKSESFSFNDSIVKSYEKPFEAFVLVNQHRKNMAKGSEAIRIVDGFPYGIYKITYRGLLIKSLNYRNTNLSGKLQIRNLKDSLLYESKFKKGTGYWKDYYYKESKLREEGKVKNNYKYGEWKYYSKSGEIDSVKVYALKDSVDVRFPYYFFNKKEPCY